MGRIQTAEDRQTGRLRSKYGITLEQKNSLLQLQGGTCPVCKTAPLTSVVDHDHTYETQTGQIKIRGILCGSCNTLLGMAKDNQEILLAAVEYLKLNDTRRADWAFKMSA